MVWYALFAVTAFNCFEIPVKLCPLYYIILLSATN